MDAVSWRLKEYLKQRKISVYELVRASGLAPTTVYAASRGEQDQIRLTTLAGILGGLRRITRENVELTDILVYEFKPDPEDRAKGLFDDSTEGLADDLSALEQGVPAEEQDAWTGTFFDQAGKRTK